jgi:metal-responsive CopG/Arc/MetJ family transcriptional regulator
MPKMIKDSKMRRQIVSIRLPKWLLDQVDKRGKRTEVIENAIMKQIGVKNESDS